MNVFNKVISLTNLQEFAASAHWPFRQTLHVADGVAVGPPPSGWRNVAGVALVVLVGLTGAGKTTLARRLAGAGLARMLPDRRELTDAVILGAGKERLDRAGRFAATAAFRKTAPGGMGEILAALSVADAPFPPLLFDGLRGEAEIAFFAQSAPEAVFIALAVSDDTRARRIAARADRFDGAASGDAARAMAVVRDEAAHYSFAASLDALNTHAAGRFHVLDAERLGPEAIDHAAAGIIRAMDD